MHGREQSERIENKGEEGGNRPEDAKLADFISGILPE